MLLLGIFLIVEFYSPVLNGQVIRTDLFPRPRVCPRHNPTPTNDTYDLAQCRREVAAAKQLIVRDADKRTGEIITDHGYNYQSHHITSRDGYIYVLHRITGGKISPPVPGKPSVILFHGLGSCSDSWFVLHSAKSLAFKLADAGFDVWMPDARGADTSQQHTSLDSDNDIEYWDFSWNEMAVTDLPAMTDLIIKESGNAKIFYIGHSQGGTIFLAGASEVPELNNKFHAAFLLAPAAYLGKAYMQSFLILLPVVYTPFETLIYRVFKGRFEMREPRTFFRYIGFDITDICSVRALQCDLCDVSYFTFFDFNRSQYNFTNTPYIKRMLNTGNLKSFIHFGQNIISCEFRKFDYGTAENMRRYGSTIPPSYATKSITTPLHIYYGEQDQFIPPPDIMKLVQNLNPSTVKEVIRVNDDTFDHADFAVARDADTLVYNGLIEKMKGYLQ